MTTATGAPVNPVMARRQLGHELRQLRELASQTGREVAEALYWSPSKISRYEWAKTVAVPEEVGKLLDYFGITGGHRDYLLRLAQAANQASWWDAYAGDLPAGQVEFIGLEHCAEAIFIWQPDVVPTLLQTGGYARQLAIQHIEPRSPRMARRSAEVTALRQHILARQSPPQVKVVLGEPALRRPVGDAQVMREQMQRLADGHPRVSVQVLPLATVAPVHTGAFTLLRFAGECLPDAVVTDHLTGGCLVEDERGAFLHWLAFEALAAAALDAAASRLRFQHKPADDARPLTRSTA